MSSDGIGKIPSLAAQLDNFHGVGAGAPAGIDREGRLVTKTPGISEEEMTGYQEELGRVLMTERNSIRTRLQDRKVGLVPAPIRPNIIQARNAITTLNEYCQTAPQSPYSSGAASVTTAGENSPDTIRRYLKDDVVHFLKEYRPELLTQIKTTPVSALGDLAREAKEAFQIHLQMEQQRMGGANLETTHTPPSAMSGGLIPEWVPPQQQGLYPHICDVFGDRLTPDQIKAGVQAGVFNWIIDYVTPELHTTTLRGSSADIINQIQRLGNTTGSSAPSTSSQPSAPPLPAEVLQTMNRILYFNGPDANAANNLLLGLGQLPRRFRHHIKNEHFIRKAEEIAQQLAQNPAYRNSAHLQVHTQHIIKECPEGPYKEALKQCLVANPPYQGTPELTEPVNAQQDPLAAKYHLTRAEAGTFRNVYGNTHESNEVQNVLKYWEDCKKLDTGMPFEYILRTAKRHPDILAQITEKHSVDNVWSFKLGTDQFMKLCIAENAEFGLLTPEDTKDWTMNILWHNSRLKEEVDTLQTMNRLHVDLTGAPIPPGDLAIALANKKMSPLKSAQFLGLPDQVKLQQCRTKAATTANIALIANSVDGSGQQPSAAALIMCQDMVRYLNDRMGDTEAENKQTSIDKAIYASAYHHWPEYQNNPTALAQIVSGTCHSDINAHHTEQVCQALKQWVSLTQEQSQTYFSSLSPRMQRDVQASYRQIGLHGLSELSVELQDVEPLPFIAYELTSQLKSIDSIKHFVPKATQEALLKDFKAIGLKPGPKTVADGSCGFSSVALLTADSPQEVRNKARKAAEDMANFMGAWDIARIDGSAEYKGRVEKASYSYMKMMQTLPVFEQHPSERARIVGHDAVANGPLPGIKPEQHWLTNEDFQYLAVAYGRPVIPFTALKPGEQMIVHYINADGEVCICDTPENYKAGLQAVKDSIPIATLGDFATAHWIPMYPTPKPRGVKTAVNVLSPAQLREQLEQQKEDEQQFMRSIQAGELQGYQNFGQRPPSPRYYDSQPQTDFTPDDADTPFQSLSALERNRYLSWRDQPHNNDFMSGDWENQ